MSETMLAPADLEPFRRELTGYCYRMLGSGFEAEDAVQETLLKAWRHADGFEGRSGVRTWLYRIATNVCIDMSRHVQRRARPMETGPSSRPDESLLGDPLPESTWVTPIHDSPPDTSDPAAVAEYRDSIRLALVAAFQYLPPRQRSVLILREVLRWQASEVAHLLEMSVPAVNSALQRARRTLGELSPELETVGAGDSDPVLVQRYVDAFERYDIDELVTLLHENAVQSMPPFAMWIEGATNIGRWMVQPGPSACRGSRLLPTTANGMPAFGQFKPDPNGGYRPWAIQVLQMSSGKIAQMHFFLADLDPQRLFPYFGLPLHLDDSPRLRRS